MKKDHPGMILLQGQVGMAAWNVWQREPGGYTCVDARSVGTSDAATVLQAKMRQNTTHQRDILWLPAFEPDEDWFFDYEKQRMIKGVELLSPHSHPATQPAPGPRRVPPHWEALLH